MASQIRCRERPAQYCREEAGADKQLQIKENNDKFLTKDGFLSKKVMPDYLHPNEAGYEIWAEAIEPNVAELMGEKPKR